MSYALPIPAPAFVSRLVDILVVALIFTALT